MKNFKTVDAWINTGLICSFVFLIIYEGRDFGIGNNLLFTSYFVVGGWQVISMLVHVLYRKYNNIGKTRHTYHLITLISLITMPVGSLWILLFTAPFMALFYTWICFDEVRKMNRRPLADLK